MAERELTDVFTEVLGDDEPPLAGVGAMLTTVRRARRRRNVVLAAGSTVAAAVLVVGAVATVPALAGLAGTPGGHTRGAAATGGNASATTGAPRASEQLASPTPLPKNWDAAAKQVLTALQAAVPDGYTTPSADTVTKGDVHYQVRGTQLVPIAERQGSTGRSLIASTDIYRGDTAGALSVNVSEDDQAPPSDLCAARITHQGTEDSCDVVTAADGTKVRVASRTIDQSHHIRYATCFHTGWTVSVQESQFGLDPNRTSLAALPMNAQQLADFATNPAFTR